MSNIALEYHISQDDLAEFLAQKLKEFQFSKEEEPFIKWWQEDSGVILECKTIEISKSLLKLDGIKLLGRSLKVVHVDEVPNIMQISSTLGIKEDLGPDHLEANALSAAVAVTALNQYQNGEGGEIALEQAELSIQTRVLKVSNVIDPKKCLELGRTEYLEIQNDMKSEFQKYGTLEYLKITFPDRIRIGAEAGSVFIAYRDQESANQAVHAMRGRKYDNRDIQLLPVPTEVFETHFNIQ